MAIKPTDIVLYLDDERYLADAVDWDGRPVKEARQPIYWENFKKHAQGLIEEHSKHNWKRYNGMLQKSINTELAKYNIEFKETKRGPYLKFRTEADITFFKLRWS